MTTTDQRWPDPAQMSDDELRAYRDQQRADLDEALILLDDASDLVEKAMYGHRVATNRAAMISRVVEYAEVEMRRRGEGRNA